MPNWMEGSLRIRAPYENMLAFFENGFDDRTSALKLSKYDDMFEVSTSYDVYILNTNRAFLIGGFDIEVDKKYCDECENVYTALRIRQAHDFDATDWHYISALYGLGLRMTGYESGLGTRRELEIDRGRILKNCETRYKTYNDWLWEAEMPFMGG